MTRCNLRFGWIGGLDPRMNLRLTNAGSRVHSLTSIFATIVHRPIHHGNSSMPLQLLQHSHLLWICLWRNIPVGCIDVHFVQSVSVGTHSGCPVSGRSILWRGRCRPIDGSEFGTGQVPTGMRVFHFLSFVHSDSLRGAGIRTVDWDFLLVRSLSTTAHGRASLQ